MLRDEILQLFTEKYVDPLYAQCVKELEERIEKNYEKIQEGIVSAFDKLFKALASGEKEVFIIIMTMLRTSLKVGKAACLLSAYDKDWYLDTKPIEITYSADWLFGGLISFVDELNRERKQYQDKITYADIELIAFEKFRQYKRYFFIMCRNAIPEIIKLDSFKEVKKCEVFQMHVGEYVDVTKCLYIEDYSRKETADVKIDLERLFDEGYMYRHYVDLDLNRGRFTGINVSYTRFEKMNLLKSLFNDGFMIGTRFEDCNLQGADFSGSSILWASFANCQLQKANFSKLNKNLEIDNQKLKSKMFTITEFTNCDLMEADFTESDLRGYRFINCYLKGCNFAGINMEHVEIDKTIAIVDVTEEQRRQIKWV